MTIVVSMLMASTATQTVSSTSGLRVVDGGTGAPGGWVAWMAWMAGWAGDEVATDVDAVNIRSLAGYVDGVNIGDGNC